MLTTLLAQSLGATETVPQVPATTYPQTTFGTFLAAISGALLFLIIFITVGVGLWIWSIVDVINRSFAGQNDKMIWVLVIVLLPFLGSIIYLIVGRKKGTMPSAPAQQESSAPLVPPIPLTQSIPSTPSAPLTPPTQPIQSDLTPPPTSPTPPVSTPPAI